MTEAQWLVKGNPRELLSFIGDRISQRKLRLFACACCSRIWPRLADVSQKAILMAEMYADGEVTSYELNDAHQAAFDLATQEINAWQKQTRFMRRPPGPMEAALAAARVVELPLGLDAVFDVTSNAGLVSGDWHGPSELRGRYTPQPEEGKQAHLLRDIVGNPFRSVAVAESWLRWNDGTVPKIAQTIYDKSHFTDLPILADALEDAGCDNDDILRHCREPAEHVRGCWAVDLLLGKC